MIATLKKSITNGKKIIPQGTVVKTIAVSWNEERVYKYLCEFEDEKIWIELSLLENIK